MGSYDTKHVRCWSVITMGVVKGMGLDSPAPASVYLSTTIRIFNGLSLLPRDHACTIKKRMHMCADYTMSKTTIDDLPNEVLDHVLRFLPAETLIGATDRVDRRWHQLSRRLRPTTINDLPNEVLENVFRFLPCVALPTSAEFVNRKWHQVSRALRSTKTYMVCNIIKRIRDPAKDPVSRCVDINICEHHDNSHDECSRIIRICPGHDTIRVFALNYNILRIVSGMTGHTYAS